MMAAGAAKRDMVYFTWNDKTLADKLQHFYAVVKGKGVMVADLWRCLLDYKSFVEATQTDASALEIFDFLIAKFN